jgi:hypothetical protein
MQFAFEHVHHHVAFILAQKPVVKRIVGREEGMS